MDGGAVAAVLSPKLIARYLPGWFDDAERLTLIEHDPGVIDGEGCRSGQTFDQVCFHDLRPVVVVTGHGEYVAFGGPWWAPLTAAAVAALLGGAGRAFIRASDRGGLTEN